MFCYCGLLNTFEHCCGRYIVAGEKADTAETLMRSRYCAYVLKNEAYLLRTWHPSTVPQVLNIVDEDIKWLGLNVLGSQKGHASDAVGQVEFRADYQLDGKFGTLHECSRFVKEQGQWFYVDGDINPGLQQTAKNKIGRNRPCVCGSGKKYKRCCGKNTA